MTGLVVVLAGGVGAGLRFVVSDLVTRRVSTELPWGTAAVNAGGALLFGVVAGAGMDGVALAAMGGGLSGFTTYSTWMVETVTLLGEGSGGRVRAGVNLIGLFAVGLALAGAGWAIGRFIA